MYYTAKDLHIALDIAFQNINSNNKLNLEPFEKDLILNETMFQEINRRINPKKNRENEGFEETYKRVEDFENLKVDTNYNQPLNVYMYSPYSVSVMLPSNYHRLINARALVYNKGNKSSVINFYDNDRYYLAYVHFPYDDSGNDLYANVRIKITDDEATDKIIFDTALASYGNLFVEDQTLVGYGQNAYTYGTLQSNDARFMVIKTMLERLNSFEGVQAKWERFGKYSRKEHLIVIVDSVKYEAIPDTISVDSDYEQIDKEAVANFNLIDQSMFDERYLTSNYSSEDLSNYNNANFEDKSIRVVKSNEYDDLRDNYFGKTNYNSPLGVIKNGELVIDKDNSFDIKGVLIEYYRKPLLIDHLINRGCEIDSDDFKVELINRAAQKLSSRINDPNYQKIANENILLT